MAIDQIWITAYDQHMDDRFLPHNVHLIDAAKFAERDPHLRSLKNQPYIYTSPLIHKFPTNIPGIYTLTGGRQIGKTTLLKQWILHLLEHAVSPNRVRFLTGEIIDNHHSLIQIINKLLDDMPQDQLLFILVDEVTYIKEWDKGIKFIADSGLLENVILMLTGSDMSIIAEARARFPGRRGQADQVDFHLYPLSFREMVILKHGILNGEEKISLLFSEFDNYLIHGGYLTALNNIAEHGHILNSTLMTYSDWIRGDVLKRGKSENYLKEFLNAILKTYGSQITWNSLSQHLSIEHHKTTQDYALVLESMDALFIQYALLEDKLAPAPKKARKVYFTDPFIYHSIFFWLTQKLLTLDKIIKPFLVETVAVNHFRRKYPTYYIKAEGEVDIAYIKNHQFWPVEIKWTNQLRSKDLKQIQKYQNSLILGKNHETINIQRIKAVPLPLFLYNEEWD